MLFTKYKYDVFISHAVEDKLPVANELCQRLEEAGLRVWYSGFDLQAGDSINDTIHKDLPRSRHAVVIFSQKYLAKNWTMQEYYLLRAQERAGRKVILPVLYEVTADDLLRKDINMADKFAIPYTKGMDYVIEKLLEVIKGLKPPKPKAAKTQLPVFKVWRAVLIVAALLAVSYFVYAFYTMSAIPDNAFVEQQITQRVKDLQENVEKVLMMGVNRHEAVPVTQHEITQVYGEFEKLKTYYRNEYEFSNGFRESHFKKNVEQDLNTDLDDLTPYNAYGFAASKMFLSPRYRDGLVDCINYTLINSMPLSYTIIASKSRENGDYEVTVQYENNIRGIYVMLIFPAQDFPKRYQVSLKGFLPTEKYVFHEEGGAWTWNTLE